MPLTTLATAPLPHALKTGPLHWAWVITLFCAGLIGFWLVLDGAYWNEDASLLDPSQSAGVLRREKGAVRQRSEKSWVWRDIGDQEYQVALGDTVFTGESGHALVRLASGSEIAITPHSLITIQQEERAAVKSGWLARLADRSAAGPARHTVEIKQGQVKLRLTPKMAPLRIKSNNTDYKLESVSANSSVELSVDPKSAGGLQLTTGSESQIKITEEKPDSAMPKAAVVVAAGHTAVIQKEQETRVYDVSLRPLRPGSGEARYINPAIAESFPAEFEWEAIDRVPPGATLSLEVQETETNHKTKQRVDPESAKATLSVRPGKYQWRLAFDSPDQKQITSSWMTFSVLGLAAPQPMAPANNSRFTTLTSEVSDLEISLSWGRAPGEAKTEVQIARDSTDFQGQKDSRVTEQSNLRLDLPLGRYFWRIRSVLPDEQVSPWSETLQFTVAAPAAIPSPLPIAVPSPVPAPRILPKLAVNTPALSTRLRSADELQKVPLIIEWNSILEAKEYRVSLFDGSKAVFKNRATSEPRLHFLLDSISGQYSYEVTALLEEGAVITSGRVNLPLELAAPVLKLPDDGAVLDGDFVLTWERTLATKSYQIQVSSDQDFSTTVVNEQVINNFYSFFEPRAGTYHWRVRSQLKDLDSGWSSTRRFIVK